MIIYLINFVTFLVLFKFAQLQLSHRILPDFEISNHLNQFIFNTSLSLSIMIFSMFLYEIFDVDDWE